MLTRSQKYAAQIYRQVCEFRDEPEKSKKYGSMAHKLPVLIRTAGLAQALAFVQSRNIKEYTQLLDHIADVVDEHELVERSRTTKDLTEYMHLTHKVLKALEWYKRFAQSVLDVQAGDGVEGGEKE